VPAAFRDAVAAIMAFSDSGAVPWVPDSLQVSLWPYEYAPDNPPLAWPDDWPDLDSPGVQRHADRFVEEVWTMNLPFSSENDVIDLLDRRRERQAVLVNDRKWAIDYRWIFPDEDAWQHVLRIIWH
jgi:hypothetical protein